MDIYRMTISELNSVITIRDVEHRNAIIKTAWNTVNFLNASLTGKFENLKYYLDLSTYEDSDPIQVKNNPDSYFTPGILDAIQCAKELGHPVPPGF